MALGLARSGQLHVPKIDVQVSAILRSQANIAATNDPASNGASTAANLIVSNAVVQRRLAGRWRATRRT